MTLHTHTGHVQDTRTILTTAVCARKTGVQNTTRKISGPTREE